MYPPADATADLAARDQRPAGPRRGSRPQEPETAFARAREAEAALKSARTVTVLDSEAEFTPKNVQTRDERVGLVFAVKMPWTTRTRS